MADVLTTRLKMTKPDVDGSDDTWGAKLNTDWDVVDRVYRDLTGELVSTSGTGSAHDVALAHNGYADIDSTLGFRLAIRSGFTNTGAMTLNVGDGNGARAVHKFVDGVSVVLAAGDFPIHYVGDFIYIRRSNFSGWVLLNPATGVVKPPVQATTAVVGVTRYATDLEAQNETLTTVAVTPKNLHSVTGGTTIPDASTTVKGKVELATSAEAIAGTDATRAVTPQALEAALDDHTPNASTSVRGIIEIATDAEALAGVDQTKALTARGLDYVYQNNNASTTNKGTTTYATGPEATAGTLFNKAINPVTLNLVVDAAMVRMDERIDARLKQLGLIPE